MVNSLADALLRRLNPVQGDIPIPRQRPSVPRGPYRPFGIGNSPVLQAQMQDAPNVGGSSLEQSPGGVAPSQSDAPQGSGVAMPQGNGLQPPRKAGGFDEETGGEPGGPYEPGTDTLSLRTGESDLHKQNIALYDAVKALDDIKRVYDPRFSDADFQADQSWRNLKDRWKTSGIPDFLGMKPVTTKDKAVLSQYAHWRSMTSNLADVILRARSGAQTSEQEMVRMNKFLPNSGGEGFFGFLDMDADGRTQYIAKLDGLTRAMKRSYIRRMWARKNGAPVERLSGEMGIFDSSMAIPGDQEFHEFDPSNPQWHDAIKWYTAQLLAKGLKPQEVKRQVVKEFGLGYQSDADRQQ